MKNTLWVTFIFVLILAGCTHGNEAVISDDKKTPEATIQNENVQLQEQVIQLQTQLQTTEKKLKDLQDSSKSQQQTPQQLVLNQFPKLADFLSPQNFQKIEIGSKKEITNPEILNLASNMIVIKQQVELGSPPQPDIEPVHYTLTTGKGTVIVNVIQQGIVSFNDLYPGIYFAVDNNASQLGKAFMQKPSYLAGEPIFSKMINSGLMRIDDKNNIYIFAAGKIRNVVMAFINAEKNEGLKIKDSSTAMLKMTFYYYGEEIMLNLFKGKAQLKDNDGEKWFDVKEQDISQIIAQLSAG
ncbi:hypothetical protein [Paenibacillus roseipurpureus]|uniref:Uncharacterized protein n=1 Tax=Paenibacillus roseopurpureus TaxID=2918901 RepID=A0AA96LRB3_9BACL|nr:hypothetical protein [Paenibacillus sp. MBLB1832]WNR44413.1 hypothetical protein MJB10_25680 [Paenibacillus sp. MBLB1832]